MVPVQEPFRTLDEVRNTILTMPFAHVMQIEIETVDDGVGVASLPLSEAVTFDGVAFAALAVGTVADIAAGAATLAMTPTDQMAYTTAIDSKVTSSTQGTRLSARAQLREQCGPRLVFDAIVHIHRRDGSSQPCGEASITMHITAPVSI